MGVFPAGTSHDLPVDTVKQIPQKYYQKCKAPWAVDADPVVQAQNAVDQALQRVEVLKAAAEKTGKIVESFTAKSNQVQAECDKAKAAAERAVNDAKDAREKAKTTRQKKDAEGITRRAQELIAVHERKDLEKMKASGELQIAIANHSFVCVDTDEAVGHADELQAIIDSKRSKVERAAKAKADREARKLAEEQAKLEAEEKAKAEAEEKARLEAEAAAKGENDDAKTATEDGETKTDDQQDDVDSGGSTDQAVEKTG